MSEKKQKERAAEIFKQYPAIDKIFITSDGQGFSDEEKAIDQARYLKDDKSIEEYDRAFFETDEADDENAGEDLERAELMEKYKALFGKSAHHNISTAKLQEQITAKEAEENK